MGKMFITDEVNDSYTGAVTSAGKLRVETGDSYFSKLTSAKHLISATVVNSAGCYLKSIIFGKSPVTAGTLTLYDTYTCASNVSAFGSSGSNVITTLYLQASADGSAIAYPRTVPINVYCTSGLAASISCSAGTTESVLGCIDNVTITYQA